MKMEIVKSLWNDIKWYLVTILGTIVIFANCSDNKVITATKHDTIYKAEKKQDVIIKQAFHKDTVLTVTKIKYVVKIKTVYDSLYVTDTLCQKSLRRLYYAFGDLNSVNDSIISNKDTIIKALIAKIDLKQSHITIDSTRIVQLIDTLPRVKRKGYFKGLRHGAVIGATLVGTALIVK